MVMFHVMLSRSGPAWEPGLALEQQAGWLAHAAFMDALVEAGFVILGGPLGDETRVVLAVASASEQTVRDTLARDPWHQTHLRIETIEPWTLRLKAR
jgi:hypothetical protein